MYTEQTGGISYETLWAQNEWMRAAHAALWHAWAEAEALSEVTPRGFAAASCARGLSLTQMVTLVAIVVPSGACPVGPRGDGWVQQAGEQATGS